MSLPCLALYVHWPWCKSKCPYCDFNAHIWDDIPQNAYIDKLIEDLTFVAEQIGNRKVVSVFFGGGTPSLMGAKPIGQVLDKVGALFQTDGAEVTVECNPTSSNQKLFQELKNVGVNRISVGIQSLNNELLKFLGREHDSKMSQYTLSHALALFNNVNADLIFGLPQQTLEDWTHQLQTITQIGVSHLSCYQLTIEPQTRFFTDVRRGAWAPADADTQADFMLQTASFLGMKEFTQYEISNFFRTAPCQHNLHVWRYGDYAGIGAGAHGRLTIDGSITATQVTKHPRNYLKHKHAFQRMALTPLSLAETWQEALLSGLRLNEGICIPTLEARLGGKLMENVSHEAMAFFHKIGFLEHTCNRIRLTNSGMMVMDHILEQITKKQPE